MLKTTLVLPALLLVLATSSLGDEITFREQELPTRLKVGYAVRLLDMNGDMRRDIVVVDSKRIIWLENPSWQEHTLLADESKKFDNVCFAPSDINKDGQRDFAVGADWQFRNTASGGTIGWITAGKQPLSNWDYHAIGQEPTVHRMQFADIDADGREELIVAPLKGRGTTDPKYAESGCRILAYDVPENPAAGPWEPRVISDKLHVVHNFWPTDFDGDGQLDLLMVSLEGVTLLERSASGAWHGTRIGTGDQQARPYTGASEIKNGHLAGGAQYIATIEPWHGNKVVVYTRPEAQRVPGQDWLWKRQVLDADLKWGHAVVCTNLDDDADEELIIGVRDDQGSQWKRGLRIYDPQDAQGLSWQRHIIDPGSVAIEDLSAGDLNGDGRSDIVAVGRQTHNVKIYWNETK